MDPKLLANITLGQIFAAIAALITSGAPATTDVTETEVIPPTKAAKAAKAKAPKEDEPDILLDDTPAPADDDNLLGDPEPAKPAAITIETLRAQAVVAIKKDAGNKAKISAVLKKVGVDSITNIPPARFEAVMKAFKTLSE